MKAINPLCSHAFASQQAQEEKDHNRHKRRRITTGTRGEGEGGF